MSAQWFYQLTGETLGPITGGELKQMAARGQLSPATLVRKGADGRWVPASEVKGLFPGYGKGKETSSEKDGTSTRQDPPVPTPPPMVGAQRTARIPSPEGDTKDAEQPDWERLQAIDASPGTKMPPVILESVAVASTDTRHAGSRYPALEIIVTIYRILALLVVVLGLAGILLSFAFGLSAGSSTSWMELIASNFIALIAVTLWAILLYGVAELITLLIDIERNTRDMSERLNREPPSGAR